VAEFPQKGFVASRTVRARDRWRVSATELLEEIVSAAERIGAAHSAFGAPIFPTNAEARLLRTLEKSRYCLSLADVARALRISRQAAQQLAHAAVATGRVELEPNPDDRRILQAFLTPAGRAWLKATSAAQRTWLIVLLNGLDDRQMATTSHVLRVIRQRLERDARELAQRKRADAKWFRMATKLP
jgi:DNA-binding MarR family transcriptional regulator